MREVCWNKFCCCVRIVFDCPWFGCLVNVCACCSWWGRRSWFMMLDWFVLMMGILSVSKWWLILFVVMRGSFNLCSVVSWRLIVMRGYEAKRTKFMCVICRWFCLRKLVFDDCLRVIRDEESRLICVHLRIDSCACVNVMTWRVRLFDSHGRPVFFLSCCFSCCFCWNFGGDGIL